jgi:hypothetical protein
MATFEPDIFTPTVKPRTLETSPADYPAALVVFNIGEATTAYEIFMEQYMDHPAPGDRNVFSDGTLLHLSDEVVSVELETGEVTMWEPVRSRGITGRFVTRLSDGRTELAHIDRGERIIFQRTNIMPRPFHDIEQTLTDRITQFFVYPSAVTGFRYRHAVLYDDLLEDIEPSGTTSGAIKAS